MIPVSDPFPGTGRLSQLREGRRAAALGATAATLESSAQTPTKEKDGDQG